MHDAQLHLPHISKKKPIHYRPAIGCDCRQYYDGRRDLLFNLDNHNIYSYIWMFDILHNIQTNHFTLWGAYDSANKTRRVAFTDNITEYGYSRLRLAYNNFVRKLDLDYQDNYMCDDCGANPKYVVFDGLSMGGRQDLLPEYEPTQLPDRKVKGSSRLKQVFLHQKETKVLRKK